MQCGNDICDPHPDTNEHTNKRRIIVVSYGEILHLLLALKSLRMSYIVWRQRVSTLLQGFWSRTSATHPTGLSYTCFSLSECPMLCENKGFLPFFKCSNVGYQSRILRAYPTLAHCPQNVLRSVETYSLPPPSLSFKCSVITHRRRISMAYPSMHPTLMSRAPPRSYSEQNDDFLPVLQDSVNTHTYTRT